VKWQLSGGFQSLGSGFWISEIERQLSCNHRTFQAEQKQDRIRQLTGLAPNLQQLTNSGGFEPLGTTGPPQSPVAWSSFITGINPGGHGLFDFLA
jgi:hypothetical protein